MAPKPAPPLLVYVRVSRIGDRDEGRLRSPDEQAQRATKFAEDNGFVVGRTIPDLNQSGGTHPLERPGMAEAIQEVEAGRAGGIVAYDSSRLSREPSHLEWLAAKMREHGAVLLWSGMPADPHSPIGELQVGLLAQIDRYQRKQAGERFKMSAEAAVLRGIPHGKVPFGYRQREEDRTIEPDPVEAPLVREVYERRIRGEGWGMIALWLGEQTGRTWSRRGIGHLVHRELYRTGRLTIGDIVSEVDSGVIVDEATWHAAQSPKVVRDGRTKKAKSLLAGILRCGTCGHALGLWYPAKAASARTAPRYQCVNLNCPNKVTVHRPVVEDMVVREAFAIDMRLVEKPQEAPDLEPLEAALTAAERRYAVVQLPESQDAFGDDWPALARLRREERDAAAQALGAARAEAGVSSAGGRVHTLGRIWEDLPPDQQREALHWVFEAVRVLKVPRGEKPDLEFVVRATRPVGAYLEMQPVEIALAPGHPVYRYLPPPRPVRPNPGQAYLEARSARQARRAKRRRDSQG